MTIAIDVAARAILRIELPSSLNDAEAERIAAAEALDRLRCVRGLVIVELDDPTRLAGDAAQTLSSGDDR